MSTTKIKFLFLMTGLSSMFFSFQHATAQQVSVNVEVKIVHQNKDGRLLPFSRDRPLQIGDFRASPPKAHTPGVAATYSGISMTIASSTENGKTTVLVTLFAYFKPEDSWMKPKGKNALVLAHEQKHFDLTALQACRLYHALKTTSFSSGWHEQLLNIQKQYMEELQHLQDQYDKDTRHGTIKDQQEAYNKKIMEEMQAQDCW
jgi:hypothetical protein